FSIDVQSQNWTVSIEYARASCCKASAANRSASGSAARADSSKLVSRWIGATSTPSRSHQRGSVDKGLEFWLHGRRSSPFLVTDVAAARPDPFRDEGRTDLDRRRAASADPDRHAPVDALGPDRLEPHRAVRAPALDRECLPGGRVR